MCVKVCVCVVTASGAACCTAVGGGGLVASSLEPRGVLGVCTAGRWGSYQASRLPKRLNSTIACFASAQYFFLILVWLEQQKNACAEADKSEHANLHLFHFSTPARAEEDGTGRLHLGGRRVAGREGGGGVGGSIAHYVCCSLKCVLTVDRLTTSSTVDYQTFVFRTFLAMPLFIFRIILCPGSVAAQQLYLACHCYPRFVLSRPS